MLSLKHVSMAKQWQTQDGARGKLPQTALLEGRHFSYNYEQNFF